MTRHIYSWLALGDSYTIGEAVPLHDSYSYQALQLLRGKGLHCHAPEIIAVTGWTTSELAAHLLHTQLSEHYDFVTLLIGVNNQYRGLPLEDCISDFEFLLKKAIHLTGNKPDHVNVISVPDWGVTPFAAKKDRKSIATQIDEMNAAQREITFKAGAGYLDITTAQRKDADDPVFVAADGLHPSGKEYRKWANQLADLLQQACH